MRAAHWIYIGGLGGVGTESSPKTRKSFRFVRPCVPCERCEAVRVRECECLLNAGAANTKKSCSSALLSAYAVLFVLASRCMGYKRFARLF